MTSNLIVIRIYLKIETCYILNITFHPTALELKCEFIIIPDRVVNLSLDELGRAGPVGPSSPKISVGRAVFLPIFREDFANILPFFKEQRLIWNKLIIKFKFSLKNLSKIRIEIKLGMTGPAWLRISAGPGRYVQRFLRPGPKIYNPDS